VDPVDGGVVIGGVVDPVDGGVVIGGVVDPVDGGVVVGGVVDRVDGGVVIGGEVVPVCDRVVAVIVWVIVVGPVAVGHALQVVDPVDGEAVIGGVPVCDRVVAVIVWVIVVGPVVIGTGHACVEQDSLNSGAFVTMNGNWISVGAAKFITHS
jgi:hypothetical protein